jgi:hypothetical protein
VPDWVATNGWSIAGVVIGLVSIGIATAIALVQRRSKRLAFEVLSRTQLVGTSGDIPELDVSFRGERVTNVEVIDLRILNTGNLAVSSSDYERPIRVSFGAESSVLTAEVVRVHPTSLRMACQPDGDGFVLEPVMLNGGDWVRVRTLVSRAGKVSADSRILGVSQITPRREGSTQRFRLLLGFGFAVLGFGLVLAASSVNSIPVLLGAIVALGASLLVTERAGPVPSALVRSTREASTFDGRPAVPSQVRLAGPPAPQGAGGDPLPLAPKRSVPAPTPWIPPMEDLDRALAKAVEAAREIGPDVVLSFLWIDVHPTHEVNFRGTSELADRNFQIFVRENEHPSVYGVRKLGADYRPLEPGNEAPWRNTPGWQELVNLSWLRVVKPFTGTAKLSVDAREQEPRWSIKYETTGALWESSCYMLADGKPVEVPCG